MKPYTTILLASTASVLGLSAALAGDFDVPGGGMKTALDAYAKQAGVQLLYADSAIKDARTSGVKGVLPADDALSRILKGSGLTIRRHGDGVLAIVRETSAASEVQVLPVQLAQASQSHPSVETVTVTSSKLGGQDVQTVPIAITAMSQEQLTATQTAGGPDLVKSVPNLTFTKTNFSGYSIQIRGIGTQAVSVTIDPAVAVAFNDTSFIRNHFFEQEFYDVSSVEILRGPQGTLYGRNSTAGVVNVISAKPTDQYEARLSADVGNYKSRRAEAMVNIPILSDKIDLRLAGEWTKRDGYAHNALLDKPVDGRNLWSGRASLLLHPIDKLTATIVYEHFNEDDDRLRSGKQLCERDNGPSTLVNAAGNTVSIANYTYKGWVGQGCLPGSLYSPSAFGTPNANANPFVAALQYVVAFIKRGTDPYSSVEQAQSLRVINSALTPTYKANNDTFEFNVEYNVSPQLTLVSQTGYSKDSLNSSQDYTRFRSKSGVFQASTGLGKEVVGRDGIFCDPQLGCSDKLIGQDISRQNSYQFSQEVRLTSAFEGPFNFSVGANYMHYQTQEEYFVFYNAITLLTRFYNQTYGGLGGLSNPAVDHAPFDEYTANYCNPKQATLPFNATGTLLGLGCSYIDPNPIDQVNGQGHNYFRSNNPYRLNSWAAFGEAYYQLTPEVKLTGGLRFTNDRKHFTQYPTWTAIAGKGYPQGDIFRQEWNEVTGRAVINWTPDLSFTDQTLVYASYSHGYKAGGANPPGVIGIIQGTTNLSSAGATTHPTTFKPEFNDAFEIGTKNTLLDGDMTLNLGAFYYKYKNYQISQIVDRTAVNLNFNAKVMGAELEATWEPVPGLRFNLAAGYENAPVDKGQSAIDLMDRTAGTPGWVVFKSYVTATSNCILPSAVVVQITASPTACLFAYSMGNTSYGGFDPRTAPNQGQGFAKSLDGKQLPNTPPVTLSFGTQYSMPITEDWAGTLRGDFYYQADSYGRIFNSRPYDELRGYTNVNFALILTNQNGWQVMGYVKNAFDKTAITGAFLNSDDSGLTTNVFLTDPRLFGVRLTKNW